MKLLLFDIDGTLINTGGAGKKSMEIAFEKIWGIHNGFAGIFMMGKTDPEILREAVSSNNLNWNERNIKKFRKTYFKTLRREIKKNSPEKGLCSGIVNLLKILDGRNHIIISLLTGNFKKSALIKLNHFKIAHFFQHGAFSDDSEKREDLVSIAKKRIEKDKNIKLSPGDIYVIGDTPLDISCAKKNGVQSIGVATGVHTFKDLKALNPDHLFSDFSDTESILKTNPFA